VPQPDRIYRPGDFIGGEWRVLRAMRGGLGLVYVVERRESGDRRVLKAPKRQSDREVRESFRAEAETWVRLGDRPNIVCAQGVDEFAGQLFVIAELIEADELGRVSLRDYLLIGVPTPPAVAALTADFCYGMAHARSKGMVAHRDIKPENLLIGASEKLRVTDFGLARAMVLGASGKEPPSGKLGGWQTNDGIIAGTPPYMSPEQCLGHQQEIGTDIYAFGVVMYEMCHGRLPFAGREFRELAPQHLCRQPDIPSGMFAALIARDKNLWHNLGLLHLQATDQAAARECFTRVLDIDPKDNIAICRLIETSQLLKDIGAVERWCEVLKGMPGGEMPSIAFRARALVHCDRYDDARKLVLDAVRKYPGEPDALIACGDVMMTHPDSSTAMSNAVTAYTGAVGILKKGIDIARTREIEERLQEAKRYLELPASPDPCCGIEAGPGAFP
jgi:serine/threonine protein kinase